MERVTLTCEVWPNSREQASKDIARVSLVVQWLKAHLEFKGHRFSPWSRKIPPAAGQLSPCATVTEPTRPRACAHQQENLPREALTPQAE